MLGAVARYIPWYHGPKCSVREGVSLARLGVPFQRCKESRMTITRGLTIQAFALVSLCGVHLATAQTPSSDDILVVAAHHVKSQVKGARIAIDPRIVSTGFVWRGSPAIRAVERTQALAERLGARVAKAETSITCTSSGQRRRCVLEGLDAVIALSDPLVNGTNAEVHVSAWWMSGRTEPEVAAMDLVLTLNLTSDGWKVVGQRLTRIT
jgi:hypothetical protein